MISNVFHEELTVIRLANESGIHIAVSYVYVIQINGIQKFSYRA